MMRLIDVDMIDTTYSDPEVIETLDNVPTVKAIPIPGGATNEDIIKALFPDMEIIDDNITVKIRLDPTRSNTIITTNYNWLGASYRG